jgi:hypothetical protein
MSWSNMTHGGTMKTGPQSNVYDYSTGNWNNTEAVPPDFRLEKPPFSAVSIDLIGETFEQRLVRLGKIAGKRQLPDGDSGREIH